MKKTLLTILILSILVLSGCRERQNIPIEKKPPIIEVIDEILADTTFNQKKHTKHFEQYISFWKKVFQTDPSITYVYYRNTNEILGKLKTRNGKTKEEQKKIDLMILDSIHTANGIKMPAKKRKRTYGIITGRLQKTTHAIEQSYKYLSMILYELKKANLPPSLALLPFIESSFNINVTSWAGAVGLWQFIESTGKHYGLVINDSIDQRLSPEHSTIAACKFIKENLNKFQKYPLIGFTAYNTGPNSEYFNDLDSLGQYKTILKMGFAPKHYFTSFIAAIRTFEEMWVQ